MKKAGLSFLIIINSIILGIWGMLVYCDRYYIDRFQIERSHDDDTRGIIWDRMYLNILEKNGQSYFMNSDFLYTYGKSGFIIINKRNGDIKVFQDETVDKDNKIRFSYFSRTRRMREGSSKPYIIRYENLMDLSYEERKMYYRLKNTYVKFPFTQNILVDKTF